jgi:hypothetical protein
MRTIEWTHCVVTYGPIVALLAALYFLRLRQSWRHFYGRHTPMISESPQPLPPAPSLPSSPPAAATARATETVTGRMAGHLERAAGKILQSVHLQPGRKCPLDKEGKCTLPEYIERVDKLELARSQRK